MPAPFAALETRVNRAIFSRLANVQGTVDGVSVSGIFENVFIDADGLGVAGTAPMFTCQSADVPGVVKGDPAVMNAINYTVVGIEPDGTGVTRLQLERA